MVTEAALFRARDGALRLLRCLAGTVSSARVVHRSVGPVASLTELGPRRSVLTRARLVTLCEAVATLAEVSEQTPRPSEAMTAWLDGGWRRPATPLTVSGASRIALIHAAAERVLLAVEDGVGSVNWVRLKAGGTAAAYRTEVDDKALLKLARSVAGCGILTPAKSGVLAAENRSEAGAYLRGRRRPAPDLNRQRHGLH